LSLAHQREKDIYPDAITEMEKMVVREKTEAKAKGQYSQ
jgi:hypothetical protein